MTPRASWKDFSLSKDAQTWGYFAPAHEPSEAKNTGPNVIPSIIGGSTKALWGALGAGAGLLKHMYDSTLGAWGIGNGAEGSALDYLKAGWNVGKDNSSLMNASIAQGVSDLVPFDNPYGRAAKEWANREQQKSEAAGLDPEDAARIRAGYGVAGQVAPMAAAWGLAAKGIGAISGGTAKMIGAGDKATRIATSIGRQVPSAYIIGDSGVKGWNAATDAADKSTNAGFAHAVLALSEEDPSSPRYFRLYDELKKSKNVNPELFDMLERPSWSPDVGGETASGGGETGWRGWYDSMPEWQKSTAWGIGGAGLGALLGSMFGKKGSWWKLALLGSLLGPLGRKYFPQQPSQT